MLIVCPACASEYDIDIDRLGAEGRAVRCAACRETWFVAPDAAASASASGMPADETAAWAAFEAGPRGRADGEAPGSMSAVPSTIIDQPSLPRRREGRASERAQPGRAASEPVWRRLLRSSPVIAAGLVVFVALPLALLGRSTVVRAMPRSAGLFAAFGLPVNLRGIEIRDVVAFRNPAEGGRPAQLVVEGDLVGVARERVAMASLEIEILDAAERPLFRWTSAAPRAALEPAETARFRASLPSPPLQGSRVEVRFADAKAGTSSKPGEAKSGETKPAEIAATAQADGARPPADPAPPGEHAGH